MAAAKPEVLIPQLIQRSNGYSQTFWIAVGTTLLSYIEAVIYIYISDFTSVFLNFGFPVTWGVIRNNSLEFLDPENRGSLLNFFTSWSRTRDSLGSFYSAGYNAKVGKTMQG